MTAGTILPVMEPQAYVDEKPSEELLLEAYPGEGSCSFIESFNKKVRLTGM